MICTKFRPINKGALIGFADLELASGMTLIDCQLLETNGKKWCSPPSRPQLDAEKKQIIKDGKPQYSACVTFKSKEVRDKWSDQAVEAIEAFAVIV